MRIIEEGFFEEKVIKCHNCTSTLGYYPTDIKWLLSTKYITCPYCEERIFLPFNNYNQPNYQYNIE